MLSPSVSECKDTVALWLLQIFYHFPLIPVRITPLLCLDLNTLGKRGNKLWQIQHWWLNQEQALETRFSELLKLAVRQRKNCRQNTFCCPKSWSILVQAIEGKKATMILLFLITNAVHPRLYITVSSIWVIRGVRWLFQLLLSSGLQRRI